MTSNRVVNKSIIENITFKMEAVPRLPMLSFELKLSPEPTQFGPTLQKYIRTHYHEDGDSYANEIKELESLRQSACKVARDFTGCSTLKRYYSQLQLLQSRFPMTQDAEAAVPFVWYDIFSGVVYSVNDIKHEQACILYNIGALHSELGAIDNRHSSDGMKVSCTHFQCAAWAFQHLRDEFLQPRGSDTSHDLLSFYIFVMLAQAQECILEKSIQDNRKSTIISKVSIQICEYYKQAQKILDSSSKPEEDSTAIIDIISFKQFKMWKKCIDLKMPYYKAISYLYQGNQAEEQQKMGERLSYYQGSSDTMNETMKIAKGLKENEIKEAISFTMDVITAKLTAGRKENDFVYHEKIPPLETLPELKGASLVKGIPFDPSDSEVSGPDIFSRLVPIEAHETSSLYSEEKAKLLRNVTQKIEDRNQSLAVFLSSLQLDQLDVIDKVMQNVLPQELVERCAALSVRPNAVPDLVTAMQALSGICTDVNADLKEIGAIVLEEETKENEYQDIIGKRAPSILSLELKNEMKKYEEAHDRASESNATLHKALSIHIQNLKQLASPLDELQSSLPSISAESLDEASLNDMKRLMSKIEEMRQQRAMLEIQLRDQMQNDDITKRVMGAGQDSDVQVLFEQELKKYDNQIILIEQNMAAQDNILGVLTEANAKYANTRKITVDISRRRESKIQSLLASYDAYEDLLEKTQKGTEFYRKLQGNVNKLLTRIKSVCKVQDEERLQLIGNNKAKESNTPIPTANMSSTPKLKDYLAYNAGSRSANSDFKDRGSAISAMGMRPSPVGAELDSVPATACSSVNPASYDQHPSSGLHGRRSFTSSSNVEPQPTNIYNASQPISPLHQPLPAPNSATSENANIAQHPVSTSQGIAVNRYPQNQAPIKFTTAHDNQQYQIPTSQQHIANSMTNYYNQQQNFSNPKIASITAMSGSTANQQPHITGSQLNQNNEYINMQYSARNTSPAVSANQYKPGVYQPTGTNMVPAGNEMVAGKIGQQQVPTYSQSQPQPQRTVGSYQVPPSMYQYPQNVAMYQQSQTTSIYQQPLSTHLPQQVSSYPQNPLATQQNPLATQRNPLMTNSQLPAVTSGAHQQFQPLSHQINPNSSSSHQTPASPIHQMSKPDLPTTGNQQLYSQYQNYPSSAQTACHTPVTPAYQQPQNNQNVVASRNQIPYQVQQPAAYLQETVPQVYQSGQGVSQASQYNNQMPSNPTVNLQTSQGINLVGSNEIPEQSYTAHQPSTNYNYNAMLQLQTHRDQVGTLHGPYQHGCTTNSSPLHQMKQNQTNYVAPYQSNTNYIPQASANNFDNSSQALSSITPQPTPADQFSTNADSQSSNIQQLLQPQVCQPISQVNATKNTRRDSASNEEQRFAGSVHSTPNSTPGPSPSHQPSMSPPINIPSDRQPFQYNASSYKQSRSADLLSSTPENRKNSAADVLEPKVLTVDDMRLQKEELDRSSSPKDPYTDSDVLTKFTNDVRRYEKFVEGLTKPTLMGQTALNQKWEELTTTQDKESRKLSISVARCYPIKNRNQDLMPYDQSRVEIKSLKDDYINASFITGISETSPKYIVTQAPLPVTYTDFWTMAWEQQTELIVCLLSDAELKSHIYWPNIKGQVNGHGPVKLSLQSTKTKPYCIERMINITHHETNISRVVIHLQLTCWPSSGLPESPIHLLQFISDIHSYYRQQRSLLRPIIAHCSGGSGRSGILCLLCAAVQDINCGRGILDVLATIIKMSSQRKYIIYDKEQLRFCYEAVLYHARDLLLKRGILTNQSSFESKTTSSDTNRHVRHPSQDFILGSGTLATMQSKLGFDVPTSSDKTEEKPSAEEKLIPATEDTLSSGGIFTDTANASFNEEKSIDNQPSAPEMMAPSTETKSNELSSLLDPKTFSLDSLSTSTKRKISKEDFASTQKGYLQEHKVDPNDPLSMLDPLWTVKK